MGIHNLRIEISSLSLCLPSLFFKINYGLLPPSPPFFSFFYLYPKCLHIYTSNFFFIIINNDDDNKNNDNDKEKEGKQ